MKTYHPTPDKEQNIQNIDHGQKATMTDHDGSTMADGSRSACDLLLLTPPFLQPNSPYPATAYLSGYLRRKGYSIAQRDLSVETLRVIFSRPFLSDMFARHTPCHDENIERIYSLRNSYVSTIDIVMALLDGSDTTGAHLICTPDFLPEAARFDSLEDMEELYGTLGSIDCAKHLCTLYIQDLSDYIRAQVDENFEVVRYGESLALAVGEFSALSGHLAQPANAIEQKMLDLLRGVMEQYDPKRVGITIPFPGNLLAALRIGGYIKTNYPDVEVILGGGYPTTELRQMTDRQIFQYCDYVILDDGELSIERLLAGSEPIHTYTETGYFDNSACISHAERGCPDYGGLDHALYFSLCEVSNPMHRLWSDGRWNKLMVAHGCYWAKCAFCDTSLDYIGRFDSVTGSTVVDWMEQVAAQTGSRNFHFVDEALPPNKLKEIALEILRRGERFSWWGNIRFESAYTGDMCRLLAASGCVAVAGGLEVASDRLLAMISKGVTIEQATIAMRNFYYAGIMVHTYLMYGLPSQTLQESVDALEVVRQMFCAELIDSAYWHRYAMTIHSPSGMNPAAWGVKRKDRMPNPFANNEVAFAENRGYDIRMVGDALVDALSNYLSGNALDRPVHKWFATKVAPTQVENSLITDHLIKPDACRLWNPAARIVWLGTRAERTEDGFMAGNNADEKYFKAPQPESDFMVKIINMCGDLNKIVNFADVEQLYQEYSQQPLSILYHSKRWDKLRGMGLLQI